MTDVPSSIEKAVDLLGSQTAVARIAGVTPQAVSDAIRHHRKMPPGWCIPIEQACAAKGIPFIRHDMRPDIYPRDGHGDDAAALHRESTVQNPTLAAGAS